MYEFIFPLNPFGGKLINANVSLMGHLQTLIGHFVKSPPFSYRSEFVKLKLNVGKGNFCGLHISVPDKPIKKVLILFHGLAGSSESDYISRTAQMAYEMNWIVIRVDHRGSGRVLGEYTEPYHSGRGEDISDVIDYSKENFPNCETIIFGVSMSGTIILNLLTGRFGKSLPDKAIVVNAPLSLHDASEKLQLGFSLLYDWRFYFKLKRMILEKHKNFYLPKIGHTATIDELYTSRMSGYRNKEHYYDECSPYRFIDRIKTETYILTAADDPFVSKDLYMQASWPRCCKVYISEAGGHVGYFSKENIRLHNRNFGRRWLDYFLFSVFQMISDEKVRS